MNPASLPVTDATPRRHDRATGAFAAGASAPLVAPMPGAPDIAAAERALLHTRGPTGAVVRLSDGLTKDEHRRGATSVSMRGAARAGSDAPCVRCRGTRAIRKNSAIDRRAVACAGRLGTPVGSDVNTPGLNSSEVAKNLEPARWVIRFGPAGLKN